MGAGEAHRQPMKRNPELRDLSEEHHYSLVAARTLRLAAEGKRSLSDAVAAFWEQWEREIGPHFRSEEEMLLPAFAGHPGSDALIARTLAEHAALRELTRSLPESAAETARLLHAHIRFEERELFPAIEAALDGPALEALGCRLRERSAAQPLSTSPRTDNPGPASSSRTPR